MRDFFTLGVSSQILVEMISYYLLISATSVQYTLNLYVGGNLKKASVENCCYKFLEEEKNSFSCSGDPWHYKLPFGQLVGFLGLL